MKRERHAGDRCSCHRLEPCSNQNGEHLVSPLSCDRSRSAVAIASHRLSFAGSAVAGLPSFSKGRAYPSMW